MCVCVRVLALFVVVFGWFVEEDLSVSIFNGGGIVQTWQHFVHGKFIGNKGSAAATFANICTASHFAHDPIPSCIACRNIWMDWAFEYFFIWFDSLAIDSFQYRYFFFATWFTFSECGNRIGNEAWTWNKGCFFPINFASL